MKQKRKFLTKKQTNKKSIKSLHHGGGRSRKGEGEKVDSDHLHFRFGKEHSDSVG